MLGKRAKAGKCGQLVDAEVPKCRACGQMRDLLRCQRCKATFYCSRNCQRSDFKNHEKLCAGIRKLECFETEKLHKQGSRLPSKLVDLVGEKCIVKCIMDGRRVEALWDTGSQLTVVGLDWLESHFPRKEVIDLRELLDYDLDVGAAGGSNIPYSGFVVLNICLDVQKKDSIELEVPVLVGKCGFDTPLIGNNVINALANEKRGNISEAMGQDFSQNGTVDIMKVLAREGEPSDVGVWVQKDYQIKPYLSGYVNAKVGNIVDGGQYLFEGEDDTGVTVADQLVRVPTGRKRFKIEVVNNTADTIRFDKNSLIGKLQIAASTTPFGLHTKENQTNGQTVTDTGRSQDLCITETNGDHLPDVSHDPTMTEEQRDRVKRMLNEHEKVFASNDAALGDFKGLEMKIHLTDNQPVRRHYNSIPRPLYDDVRNHITDMLHRGIIQPSTSNYSSPLVLVRKKDGTMRICVDYRAVNAKTVGESNPIPRIQDIMDSLGGMHYFTTIDMKEAYHQGYVHEDSRHVTAFTCPLGLYEYIRIPFGLRNAVPNFQRSIDKCLEGLRHRICVPYIDDTIVFSKNFEDHVRDVGEVLTRLGESGVKLKGSKCRLFKREVVYLGRRITSEGYTIDAGNIAAIVDIKSRRPNTVGGVRKILGLLSYYRRYVEGFAKIARPINQLLKAEQDTKTNKRGQVASSQQIHWTDECQTATETIIDAITREPVMGYPDFDQPFILHTDASGKGLGAILYQKQGGRVKVIAYASRSLLDAEKRYHSSKLEFLCMKWAVTEHFRNYLFYSQKFTVVTDNNPLTYCMTTAKLNATTVRWVNELADFDFDIRYKPGRNHNDVDTLSRLPLDIDSYLALCGEHVGVSRVSQVLGSIKAVSVSRIPSIALANRITLDQLGGCHVSAVEKVSLNEFRRAQLRDGDIQKAIEATRTGGKPPAGKLRGESRVFRGLMNSFHKLSVREGVLYRFNGGLQCMVVPKEFRGVVYRELHVKMGHLGADRVLQLARERFYWVGMERDIREFISKRCSCLRDKKPRLQTRAPMQSIESSSPWELLSVDFLELEKSGAYRYLLVIVDHFTRYATVYPTTNKSAKTAASKVFDDCALTYGYPKRIHSDQGGEFINKIWSEFTDLCGIRKSNTTPYHPEGNGQCERYNRTILDMLRTLGDEQKARWPKYAKKLTHAYNCTKNDATGFSPFRLLYGRNPRLPVDLMFEKVHVEGKKEYTQYVREWEEMMREVYIQAGNSSRTNMRRGREHANRRVRSTVLEVGGRVLVRRMRDDKGQGKLRAYWEDDTYNVLRQLNNSSVYEVVNGRTGKVRVIHRNMMMPVDEIPVPQEGHRVVRKPREAREERDEREGTGLDGDSDTSTDETDAGGIGRQRRPKRARRCPSRLNYANRGSPLVNSLYPATKGKSYRGSQLGVRKGIAPGYL